MGAVPLHRPLQALLQRHPRLPPRERVELAVVDPLALDLPLGDARAPDVGLDLALRLARSSAANVVLLGPDDESSTADLSARATEAYERTGVWTTPMPVQGEPGLALVEQAIKMFQCILLR